MSFRRPREYYRNRNGFIEERDQYPLENRKDEEAAEAQDLARFVMREMGSFFPSLEEMKREAETYETVATTIERIKRLKKEHADGISKLASYYAQGVYDDAMDRYLQTDDLKYFDDDLARDDEWSEHYARLEDFFRRSGRIYKSEFYNVLARTQYDHLQELLPLYKRLRELKEMEEAARIKRESQFPQTIQEYRSMGLKDARLRVARFLMADAPKRELMRTTSHWAWRQTEPLIKEYNGNREFQREIENMVREVETTDPRARNRGM
ncbi:hypothetical protein DFH11DRAFT_1687892 [Phellopilus nigrolimitatus]|nr:hypothetical protein DFH11DRAFT_1687892 [Phellopilus nigrolimitatus]